MHEVPVSQFRERNSRTSHEIKGKKKKEKTNKMYQINLRFLYKSYNYGIMINGTRPNCSETETHRSLEFLIPIFAKFFPIFFSLLSFVQLSVPTNATGLCSTMSSMIDDHQLVTSILEKFHRFFRILRHRHAPPQSPRSGREYVHLLVIFREDQ